MNLTVTLDTPHSARLQISGDLDFVGAPALLDTVSALMSRHDELRHLHIDFANLTFCDSAGLSALVIVHRRCSESRVRLHLDHKTGQLDRILTVTGLADHFTAAHGAGSGAKGTQDETVG